MLGRGAQRKQQIKFIKALQNMGWWVGVTRYPHTGICTIFFIYVNVYGIYLYLCSVYIVVVVFVLNIV